MQHIRKKAPRYLSYTDRTGEIAFAVIMVMIINGYVALSKLNTGFLYIVAVNLGACISWGFIDGFIYATSNSIERNNNRRTLLLLQSSNAEGRDQIAKAKDALEDTFLAKFDSKGKDAIAYTILENAPQASLGKNQIFVKEELFGWLSIILIYLITGFVLALPYLILPGKINAWFVSNSAGSVLLFWYGTLLGKSLGRSRLLLGIFLAAVGIALLVISYLVWSVYLV